MPEPSRLTLLTRPGCHLCDDARAVVARVAGELALRWDERSIAGDAELERAYGELVPVVLVDGRQHAVWRVDPDRLRLALQHGPGTSTWTARWLRRTP